MGYKRMDDRAKAERELLKMRYVRPYSPEESKAIGKYKDGTFGVSNLAFALYSNGRNARGKSLERPFGLMYEDGSTLFSIGYFKKEHDSEDAPGYVLIVAPRGKHAIQRIVEIAERALHDDSIPCAGVYARFLALDQYLELLGEGFLPVKESPWHPEAPEEDETYTHSIVTIDDLLADSEGIDVKVIPGLSQNSRRKARDNYERFRNFLERNQMEYELCELTDTRIEAARTVIGAHFGMLAQKGKAIGSTQEDHQNSLDFRMLALPDVLAYVGYLDGQPVSVFVGEWVSPNRFALYTPFTLRDVRVVEVQDEVGVTALPLYAYVRLFSQLRQRGIAEVHLGGSELPDLNVFKRRLGGKNDPSYWAVRLK